MDITTILELQTDSILDIFNSQEKEYLCKTKYFLQDIVVSLQYSILLLQTVALRISYVASKFLFGKLNQYMQGLLLQLAMVLHMFLLRNEWGH